MVGLREAVDALRVRGLEGVRTCALDDGNECAWVEDDLRMSSIKIMSILSNTRRISEW